MFLCIDVGNTRTKAAVFDLQGTLLESIIVAENNLESIHTLIHRHTIEHVIMSSTGHLDWHISQLGISGKNIELNHVMQDRPIGIDYLAKITEASVIY